MAWYNVNVKQLVADAELTADDRQVKPAGKYVFDVADKDGALDVFHGTVPIKCLDHFSVEVEREKA